jgi:hypothetical protein
VEEEEDEVLVDDDHGHVADAVASLVLKYTAVVLNELPGVGAPRKT